MERCPKKRDFFFNRLYISVTWRSAQNFRGSNYFCNTIPSSELEEKLLTLACPLCVWGKYFYKDWITWPYRTTFPTHSLWAFGSESVGLITIVSVSHQQQSPGDAGLERVFAGESQCLIKDPPCSFTPQISSLQIHSPCEHSEAYLLCTSGYGRLQMETSEIHGWLAWLT